MEILGGPLFAVAGGGESHGPAIITVVFGCPAGLHLKRSEIQVLLDRRLILTVLGELVARARQTALFVFELGFQRRHLAVRSREPLGEFGSRQSALLVPELELLGDFTRVGQVPAKVRGGERRPVCHFTLRFGLLIEDGDRSARRPEQRQRHWNRPSQDRLDPLPSLLGEREC